MTSSATSMLTTTFIDDKRPIGTFIKMTFSGYKTAEAMKKMLESMVSSKVEDACYWTAELICSGHYAEIWDTIFLFYGKYVHVANPKLAIYINTKMSKFKENMNNASSAQEQLDFRNEPAFRHMLCEIIITLCQSDKKFVLNYASVPDGDFELVTLKNNLTATDFSRAEKIIKPEDPRELMVTINELQLCLTCKVSSTTRANYWVEWLLDYAKLCKKRKQPCHIQKREHDFVDPKYQRNIVWLIWDAIQNEANERQSNIIIKVISSLLRMFALRYTESSNTRRKCLIYFAVALLTVCPPGTAEHIPMIRDKTRLECAMMQVDKVFTHVRNVAKESMESSSEKNDVTAKVDADTSIDKMRIISIFEKTHGTTRSAP